MKTTLEFKPGYRRVSYEFIDSGCRIRSETYIPAECISLKNGYDNTDDARDYLRKYKGINGVIDWVWFH